MADVWGYCKAYLSTDIQCDTRWSCPVCHDQISKEVCQWTCSNDSEFNNKENRTVSCQMIPKLHPCWRFVMSKDQRVLSATCSFALLIGWHPQPQVKRANFGIVVAPVKGSCHLTVFHSCWFKINYRTNWQREEIESFLHDTTWI